MWRNHSVLTVVFVDGSEQQKELVKKYAPLWVEGSSLSFRFFDNTDQAPVKSHIRVSFNHHTGSRLGDHKDYDSKAPTLQLQKLNLLHPASLAARRLILHEFGHALGLEHEYRHPKWPFGQQAINEQINLCIPTMKSLGHSNNEANLKCVETNKTLKSENVNATIYDEESIMNYPQKILLEDSRYKQIPAKTSLSILDKVAIRRWYIK